MPTLVIALTNFSIEWALSPESKLGDVSFRSFIDDGGSISPEKLVACMNPELGIDQLDNDQTCNLDESYKEAKPVASLIEITNVQEHDDDSVRFDVKYVFDDFKTKDEEQCLQDLIDGSRDIGFYAVQLKVDILKGFGLRNNRNTKPDVVIKYS